MKLMNGKVLQWESSVPGEAPTKTSSVNAACDAFFRKRGMMAGPGSKGWLYGRRARRRASVQCSVGAGAPQLRSDGEEAA